MMDFVKFFEGPFCTGEANFLYQIWLEGQISALGHNHIIKHVDPFWGSFWPGSYQTSEPSQNWAEKTCECPVRRAGLFLKFLFILAASLWALQSFGSISGVQEKGKGQGRSHCLLRDTMTTCLDPDNVSHLLYRHWLPGGWCSPASFPWTITENEAVTYPQGFIE